MTGIEAFLEVLAEAGVRHIFGNPGSTELPLNDALSRDPRFEYIFGIHEIPVMAAAGGFAMASGRPAVVNLHTLAGLCNAMGMLSNSFHEGTPLLVTAGQQDTRLRFDEPVIEGDLVRVARPLVKWAAEVNRVEDMPNAVRRALQIAMAPPTGPVFLSLPLDVQQASADNLDTSPPWRPDGHVRPAPDALHRTADILASAANPVILAGSRVTETNGCNELAAMAECLGAPVYAESAASHGRLPMASHHPLYRGPISHWSPEIHRTLAQHDLAFVVGMNFLRLYIHMDPVNPLPPGLRVVHLDNHVREIGKNFSIEMGLFCDPKAGLNDLLHEVRARLSPTQCEAIAIRNMDAEIAAEEMRRALRADLDRELVSHPMTGRALMHTLAKVLPPNAAVIEEAPSTHGNLWEKLGILRDPNAFFAHRGWALGWGIGTALGVKLAWPNRPVLALLGDGATLYGLQGLWTAARHRIPVTFVVCNNSRYQVLQLCGDVMNLPSLRTPAVTGMTLGDPAVDFVALARSLGVEAFRATTPEELAEHTRYGLAHNLPVLIDAVIA